MPDFGTRKGATAPAPYWGLWRRLLVAIFLLAPGSAWFWPLWRGQVLLAGLTPLWDQWHINVPFAFLLSETLCEGRLPLWTDRIGGGYPLHALGEAGVLYPPNLVLYALLPPLLAYGIQTWLTVVLAHANAYFFCRDLGCSRAASLLGGVAYSFSGYFVVHLPTLHSAQAAAWTPLLLLTVRRGAVSGRLNRWVLAGVVLAVQITTGYPQVVYYSVVAAVLLALWEWGGVGVWRCRNLRSFLGPLLATGVALGLSAAHWLPGVEMVRQSARLGGLDFEEATLFSYPPANLLTFVAPYAFGNPAEGKNQGWSEKGHFWDNGYIGLAPLGLALFAMAAGIRRDRRVRCFTWLFAFSMGVVLGRHTPFFRLLWHVFPGMALFRFPSRFIVVADLSLATLAAFGLDALRRQLAATRQPRGISTPVPQSPPFWAAALMLVTLVDLFTFAGRFQRFVWASEWWTSPPTARFLANAQRSLVVPQTSPLTQPVYYSLGYLRWPGALEGQKKGWKRDLAPFLAHRNTLPPNTGLLYGLRCFNAFVGLDTKRAASLYVAFSEDRYVSGPTVAVRNRLPKALALLGVSHLVTTYPMPRSASGLTSVYESRCGAGGTTVRVYAIEGARGLIWIPNVVYPVADARTALRQVRDGLAIVVEDSGQLPLRTQGSVKHAQAGSGWARARVWLASPGYVLYNQRHYPGWRATVDGRPVAVRTANFLMQAVLVPAGEHMLEFRFVPTSYRLGCFAGGLTLTLLVAVAVRRAFLLWRSDRRQGSFRR